MLLWVVAVDDGDDGEEEEEEDEDDEEEEDAVAAVGSGKVELTVAARGPAERRKDTTVIWEGEMEKKIYTNVLGICFT